MAKSVLQCFVCIVISVVLCVRAQWAIEDDGCRTPDRGTGSCVKIYSCKPMMDLLEKVPQPLPTRVANLLKSYQCGFEGNQPKVCCPSKPILLSGVTSSNINNPQIPPPPDVSRHRNINLLPKTCGHMDTTERIIYGNKTGLFEFPWMALLSYRTRNGPSFKCGATIINDRYILTAAHCITNLKSPIIGVRVGDHDTSTREDCEDQDGERVCAPPYQDLAIENIIPHPEYSTRAYTNDIGLLRVTRMDISLENIRPVCLPLDKTRNYNFTGRNVVVTGWGATETARNSDDLLKAEIPIVGLEDCQNTYRKLTKNTISYRHLCAGGKTKSDSCAGDSGGPLHVVAQLHADQRLIQQGIVSFGPRDCGQNGIPGVYTRVAYYMDWILDNIRP